MKRKSKTSKLEKKKIELEIDLLEKPWWKKSEYLRIIIPIFFGIASLVAFPKNADLFGSLVSAIELMKEIMDENHQFKSILLFNSLTALLFTTANIIIEYSGSMFNEIYYKNNSHPHPFIRIIKCNEQILGNISENLNTPNEILEAILQRSTTMISQILYTNKRTLDYGKFYNQNSNRIEEYIIEIEETNKLYKELTRFKSKEFIDKFFI